MLLSALINILHIVYNQQLKYLRYTYELPIHFKNAADLRYYYFFLNIQSIIFLIVTIYYSLPFFSFVGLVGSFQSIITIVNIFADKNLSKTIIEW